MRKILLRYHRSIFFPSLFDADAEILLKELNRRNWRFGFHSIRKLLQVNIETANLVLKKIYRYKIQSDDIFEVYYVDSGEIAKICIRISLTEKEDLILVIDKDKVIVTIYLNKVSDNHGALDTSEYVTKEKGEIQSVQG